MKARLVSLGDAGEISAILRAELAGAGKATVRDIATCLGKLALHFWTPDYTPEQAKQRYGDFVQDLDGVTAQELANACQEYRLDPKNSFFPTPGKLRVLVADALAERKLRVAGAEVLLQALNAPPSITDTLGRGGPIGERLAALNEAMKAKTAETINLQEDENAPRRPATARDHTDASELLATLGKKVGKTPDELRRDHPVPSESA